MRFYDRRIAEDTTGSTLEHSHRFRVLWQAVRDKGGQDLSTEELRQVQFAIDDDQDRDILENPLGFTEEEQTERACEEQLYHEHAASVALRGVLRAGLRNRIFPNEDVQFHDIGSDGALRVTILGEEYRLRLDKA